MTSWKFSSSFIKMLLALLFFHFFESVSSEINFKEAISEAQKMLSLIKNRYELDTNIYGKQFWLTANNVGKHTWSLMKYKYALKMVQPKSTFLMTFGGSSVTAGHDNYYNQSYPFVVERRMKNMLKLAGIELIVRNIAHGANNCIPYSFCYEALGGKDPDFLNWEQSYNCGRDEAVFELMGRVAAFSKNYATLYFSASGAWTPDKCAASTVDPPYCSEEWQPTGLPEWKPTHNDVDAVKAELFHWNEANPSSKRFGSWANWNEGYQSIAPHGFNVWEENPLCNATKKKCSAADVATPCGNMKFMTKEASVYGQPSGKGARWHPSRSFHLLRGEAIAWLYGLAFLDALYMVEKDVKVHKEGNLVKEYTTKLNGLRTAPKNLPHAKGCSKYNCFWRPHCFTDFKAHFGEEKRLSEIVVGHTNWTYDPSEYSDWSRTYGYLDAKPAYYAHGQEAGEIHVVVTLSYSNQVWLCGVKEAFKHTLIYVDLNVDIQEIVDDPKSYVPSSKRTLWSLKKYVGSECKSINELPPGTHVISIITDPEAHARGDKPTTSLSHVITWG